MSQPSETMRSWQERLQAVAASEGKPDPLPKFGADGLGGHETQAAIIAFQASRNPPLPQTGQLDLPTRTALEQPPKRAISSADVAVASAVIANLPFIPKELKEILLFPTIVQMIIAILPGVPDDIKLVEAEVAELASSDSGIKKLRTALVFGKALIDKIQAIVDKVDPQGAVQPPASQVNIINTAPTV